MPRAGIAFRADPAGAVSAARQRGGRPIPWRDGERAARHASRDATTSSRTRSWASAATCRRRPTSPRAPPDADRGARGERRARAREPARRPLRGRRRDELRHALRGAVVTGMPLRARDRRTRRALRSPRTGDPGPGRGAPRSRVAGGRPRRAGDGRLPRCLPPQRGDGGGDPGDRRARPARAAHHGQGKGRRAQRRPAATWPRSSATNMSSASTSTTWRGPTRPPTPSCAARAPSRSPRSPRSALPALYVPLPIGNGEQALNAAPAVEAGAALIIEDDLLTPASVTLSLEEMLLDDDDHDRIVAAALAPERARRKRAACRHD